MCNILEKCYNLIETVADSDLVGLHNSIEDFLFQDIDISVVKPLLPQWVAYDGISAESECSKKEYEKSRQRHNNAYVNRFIYYYDICSLVSAIQDRLLATEYHMREYYKTIPFEIKHKKNEYTSCSRASDPETTFSFAALNSIFVSLASSFDILAKVAIEQNSYSEYDFSRYSKMKSDGILFNRSGNKNISSELKKDGLLFSVPLCTKKILSFRDEYVHNGPWDMRCSTYLTAIDGNPADVIMLSPDMDENGNFVSLGSRNKFYSQNNIINATLPYLVYEVTEIIGRTVTEMALLFQKNTTRAIDRKKTKECIKHVSVFCGSVLAKYLGYIKACE